MPFNGRIHFNSRLKRLLLLVCIIALIALMQMMTRIGPIDCDHQLSILRPHITPKVKPTYERPSIESSWTPLIDNWLTIYSAFLTEDSIVRIVSMVDQNVWSEKQVTIECQFRTTKAPDLSSMASLTILSENYYGKKRFAAARIACALPFQDHSIVKYVGIRLNSKSFVRSLLPIIETNSSDSSDTTICVRPVFHSEQLLPSVLEFLAYYRANNISKIVFYDFDIDSKLKTFLRSLEFVETIPFKLTLDLNSIHAFGQMAAIDDCLLRYSNSPIIFVDVDEFIVVRSGHKRTIQSLIVDKIRDQSISSMIVNNRFLCHEFQVNHTYPQILSHDRIQTYSWMPGSRSKMIVLRPRTVTDIGIHMVFETLSGYDVIEMNDNELLLYHFRSCCGVNQELIHFEHLDLYFKTIRDYYVEDNRIKAFEPEITQFMSDHAIITNTEPDI